MFGFHGQLFSQFVVRNVRLYCILKRLGGVVCSGVRSDLLVPALRLCLARHVRVLLVCTRALCCVVLRCVGCGFVYVGTEKAVLEIDRSNGDFDACSGWFTKTNQWRSPINDD